MISIIFSHSFFDMPQVANNNYNTCSRLRQSLFIIKQYEYLLNSYVLDFYIDDHWNKLPTSWRDCFENLEPAELGSILCHKSHTTVLPLSFLALLINVERLSIQRHKSEFHKDKKLTDNASTETDTVQAWNGPSKMNNLFLKHVKLKKRHEIALMADTVAKVSAMADCDITIDVGSGLGHLARMLAYKYNLKMIGIECQEKLTKQARKLDEEFEYTASKYSIDTNIMHRPRHINMQITHDGSLGAVLMEKNANFGLVGLHPCGDLGPTLLRHFVNCDEIKSICVVGCCYMKLTCDDLNTSGYPMSLFANRIKDHTLSYESREIACHAIEIYSRRLQAGDYRDLQVHSYRAALEKILVSKDPQLKHTGIKSVKHSKGLTFQRYCDLATEMLPVKITSEDTSSHDIQSNLKRWRQVVIFYTCRLILAPLVETVILLDRLLYLHEHNVICDISPVFDPLLSPRNHILVGRKL